MGQGSGKAAGVSKGAKRYTTGTHRVFAPEETLERMRPHWRKLGVTRLADVTGLDRIGIPVIMAIRPNSRSVAVSQGKGVHLAAAKASALMETVETWHAERISAPTLYGSYEDLSQTHPLCDPGLLPQVQGSRFHPGLRLLWIEADDLMTGTPAWIPYEMVHTDYTVPAPSGQGCFPCTSNGLASGNTLIEAQCHAICEVIERDASTLFHHLSPVERKARKVDLSDIDHPECSEILERMETAGLEMTVWNTTADTGVASFYGVLVPPEGTLEHIGAGAGTHTSRAVALSRTLTEAVQTRLTYISGARDDLLADEFELEGLEEKLQAARRLIGDDAGTFPYDDVPDVWHGTVEEDLQHLLARLNSVGVPHVYSVDLSRDDLPVSVVRVVIPGLEAPHDDDNFMPGPRALELSGTA